jgi:hypothetical protein
MKPALLVLEPFTDQEIGSLVLLVDNQIEYLRKNNEMGFYNPWIEYYANIVKKLLNMRHDK